MLLLQPLHKLEEPICQARHYEHQGDGPHVAVLPLQLGHKLKVHTIHACNKCRGHEDYGCHGEDLNNLILLYINKTQRSILYIVETLEAEGSMADE